MWWRGTDLFGGCLGGNIDLFSLLALFVGVTICTATTRLRAMVLFMCGYGLIAVMSGTHPRFFNYPRFFNLNDQRARLREVYLGF